MWLDVRYDQNRGPYNQYPLYVRSLDASEPPKNRALSAGAPDSDAAVQTQSGGESGMIKCRGSVEKSVKPPKWRSATSN